MHARLKVRPENQIDGWSWVLGMEASFAIERQGQNILVGIVFMFELYCRGAKIRRDLTETNVFKRHVKEMFYFRAIA